MHIYFTGCNFTLILVSALTNLCTLFQTEKASELGIGPQAMPNVAGYSTCDRLRHFDSPRSLDVALENA
jgi:hypothetical protein